MLGITYSPVASGGPGGTHWPGRLVFSIGKQVALNTQLKVPVESQPVPLTGLVKQAPIQRQQEAQTRGRAAQNQPSTCLLLRAVTGSNGSHLSGRYNLLYSC